jgi:hypothetical protein
MNNFLAYLCGFGLLCVLVVLMSTAARNATLTEGKRELQIEAVELGLGDWIPDHKGKTVFQWRLQKTRHKQGELVYVVKGVFAGHEAILGLADDYAYQLCHIKGNYGESSYIGTLRDSDFVRSALVDTETNEILWSEK